MSEPPDELVAVAIGSVSRWQQNHLDAVRRAWVQLLTWLREHHRKQFDSFDGSVEAYYTRRFLDSIVNANAPMAVNTETSAQPFLRDGQSVAPSIKIALTWLEEHLGVNLCMRTLSLEAIPRAPQRPSRPATAIPLKACCTLEKTAASRVPLPLRVVCAFACLMILGVSRFTQLQDSRWVSMCCLHKIRVVKAINRAEKCRGSHGEDDGNYSVKRWEFSQRKWFGSGVRQGRAGRCAR